MIIKIINNDNNQLFILDTGLINIDIDVLLEILQKYHINCCIQNDILKQQSEEFEIKN